MSLRHLLSARLCWFLESGAFCVDCSALHKGLKWQLLRKSRTDCILTSVFVRVRLHFNHIQYWLTLSSNHFLQSWCYTWNGTCTYLLMKFLTERENWCVLLSCCQTELKWSSDLQSQRRALPFQSELSGSHRGGKKMFSIATLKQILLLDMRES